MNVKEKPALLLERAKAEHDACIEEIILQWDAKRLQGILKTVPISIIIAAVFLCAYGFSVQTLQAFLLCQILIFASFYDIRTHTVPDAVHLFILLVGLIEVSLLPAVSGFLLVPLPFMLAAMFKTGSIGGGDIKLMAACGFVLGVSRGFTASFIGLVLAVLVNGVHKRRNRPFPLVPYLTAGCFAALLPI